MNEERLESFRKMLLNLREQLWIEVKHRRDEAADMRDQGVSDLGDAGLTEDLRTFLNQLSDGKREQILEIDEALQRIDDRSYGICENCGEEIKAERLQVQPAARHCVSCKEELEATEVKKTEPQTGKI